MFKRELPSSELLIGRFDRLAADCQPLLRHMGRQVVAAAQGRQYDGVVVDQNSGAPVATFVTRLLENCGLGIGLNAVIPVRASRAACAVVAHSVYVDYFADRLPRGARRLLLVTDNIHTGGTLNGIAASIREVRAGSSAVMDVAAVASRYDPERRLEAGNFNKIMVGGVGYSSTQIARRTFEMVTDEPGLFAQLKRFAPLSIKQFVQAHFPGADEQMAFPIHGLDESVHVGLAYSVPLEDNSYRQVTEHVQATMLSMADELRAELGLNS